MFFFLAKGGLGWPAHKPGERLLFGSSPCELLAMKKAFLLLYLAATNYDRILNVHHFLVVGPLESYTRQTPSFCGKGRHPMGRVGKGKVIHSIYHGLRVAIAEAPLLAIEVWGQAREPDLVLRT